MFSGLPTAQSEWVLVEYAKAETRRHVEENARRLSTRLGDAAKSAAGSIPVFNPKGPAKAPPAPTAAVADDAADEVVADAVVSLQCATGDILRALAQLRGLQFGGQPTSDPATANSSGPTFAPPATNLVRPSSFFFDRVEALRELSSVCEAAARALDAEDRTYLFSSAMSVPATGSRRAIAADETRASYAFFVDTAHSVHSAALIIIGMVDEAQKRQQRLLERAQNRPASPPRDEAFVHDVSIPFAKILQSAEALYEQPFSVFHATGCRHRLLQPSSFGPLRTILAEVDSEVERLSHVQRVLEESHTRDHGRTADTTPVIFEPSLYRFQFLSNTLRLYYMASLVQDEENTADYFDGAVQMIRVQLGHVKALIDENRKEILAAVEKRHRAEASEDATPKDARSRPSTASPAEGGEDVLYPYYTDDERHALDVTFQAFTDLRSQCQQLHSKIRKDISHKNRTHGVIYTGGASHAASGAREKVRFATALPDIFPSFEASCFSSNRSSGLQGNTAPQPPASRSAAKTESWGSWWSNIKKSTVGFLTCQVDPAVAQAERARAAPVSEPPASLNRFVSPGVHRKEAIDFTLVETIAECDAIDKILCDTYPTLYCTDWRHRLQRAVASVAKSAEKVSVVFGHPV